MKRHRAHKDKLRLQPNLGSRVTSFSKNLVLNQVGQGKNVLDELSLRTEFPLYLEVYVEVKFYLEPCWSPTKPELLLCHLFAPVFSLSLQPQDLHCLSLQPLLKRSLFSWRI